MRAACFINLPMLGIKSCWRRVVGWSWSSGADFHDLAFENLERLADQRVVFKVVLGERNRLRPGFVWRHIPFFPCGAGRRPGGGNGCAVGGRFGGGLWQPYAAG